MSTKVIFFRNGTRKTETGVEKVRCDGNYWVIVYKDKSKREAKIPINKVKDIK